MVLQVRRDVVYVVQCCLGVYINGYRVVDMDLASDGSVHTTGDVVVASHSFFLPRPEYVRHLAITVIISLL